jgi:hypothetical protein
MEGRIMPSDQSAEEITQHCQCGNDTYHIKTSVDRQKAWAECTECGRPTGVFGDGFEKQQRWNQNAE